MKMIKIQQGLLINPDSIDSIERVNEVTTGFSKIYVTVNGTKHECFVPFEELMSQLMHSGLEASMQTWVG